MDQVKSNIVITIDGPSGSGKGTLSRLLAKRLGFHLLDSGALYRLVALSATKQQIDMQDEDAVAEIAYHLNVLFDIQGESTQILLSGEDVTHLIRLETVGMNASFVAAYPAVRAALLQRQRNFAQAPGLVADGRDMGTVVFPQAIVKVFLTASAEARAERRFKQLQQNGASVDMVELINDIKARDERDINRSVSPLKPAVNALIIDSTTLNIQQVLGLMLAKAHNAISV